MSQESGTATARRQSTRCETVFGLHNQMLLAARSNRMRTSARDGNDHETLCRQWCAPLSSSQKPARMKGLGGGGVVVGQDEHIVIQGDTEDVLPLLCKIPTDMHCFYS